MADDEFETPEMPSEEVVEALRGSSKERARVSEATSCVERCCMMRGLPQTVDLDSGDDELIP